MPTKPTQNALHWNRSFHELHCDSIVAKRIHWNIKLRWTTNGLAINLIDLWSEQSRVSTALKTAHEIDIWQSINSTNPMHFFYQIDWCWNGAANVCVHCPYLCYIDWNNYWIRIHPICIDCIEATNQYTQRAHGIFYSICNSINFFLLTFFLFQKIVFFGGKLCTAQCDHELFLAHAIYFRF